MQARMNNWIYIRKGFLILSSSNDFKLVQSIIYNLKKKNLHHVLNLLPIDKGIRYSP